MDEILNTLNALVPAKYQTLLLFAVVFTRLSGEMFSALKSQGGLRGLYRGLLFGENIPKPISDEFRQELKIKPNEETK